MQVQFSVISLAINEKSGGAIDSPSRAALEILPDSRRVHPGDNFLHQAFGIETQTRGVLSEHVVLKGVLMFKQESVHFPKLALNAGGFGCFSRVLGMGMCIGRGKVSKDET